jgi:hypothetical protein
MARIQGILFLFLGLGILGVVANGIRMGRLPFGSKGFSGRYEVERDTSAAGFWLLAAAYCIGGLWLFFYSISLLLGTATPLPLR